MFLLLVSSHRNGGDGIKGIKGIGKTDNFYAEVNVKGELNTYLNQEVGLFIDGDIAMLDFTVEDGGSFNSCQNGGKDINNVGTVNYVDERTIA